MGSQTTAVTSSMNRHTIAYHQLMDDLNSHMAHYQFPRPMRRHLRSFFMNNRDAEETGAWNKIMHRMSPIMRTEVCFFLHSEHLQKVPFLKHAPKPFISTLALDVQHRAIAQKETFGEDFVVYILQSGLCSKGEGRLSILSPGAVWGEEHLLLTSWWLLRANTAYTLTFTEYFYLSRSFFEKVVVEFPEMQPRVRRFTVWYAV